MEAYSQLTSVLFADVAGMAPLREKLGEAEASHATERCIKRIERSVAAFRGRIENVRGGRLLAMFELADDALHAACDMQQRISDLPPVSGIKPGLRVGLHLAASAMPPDAFSDEVIHAAASLGELACAGQIVASANIVASLSESLQLTAQKLHRTAGVGGVNGLQLFDIPWSGGKPVAGATAEPRQAERNVRNAQPEGFPAGCANGLATQPLTHALPGKKLSVRHGGKAFVVDEQQPVLLLGRDPGLHVVIRDQRASRHHAKIELRDGEYVLTDHSTNGTYVSFGNHPEILLRHGEIIILDNGRMSFATSAASDGSDILEFDYR